MDLAINFSKRSSQLNVLPQFCLPKFAAPDSRRNVFTTLLLRDRFHAVTGSSSTGLSRVFGG